MTGTKGEDQAKQLRDEMEVYEERKTEAIVHSLPPRSRIHRMKKAKKSKFKLSFPLIRLLLVLFIALIITALTSPYWLP